MAYQLKWLKQITCLSWLKRLIWLKGPIKFVQNCDCEAKAENRQINIHFLEEKRDFLEEKQDFKELKCLTMARGRYFR